MSEYIRPAIPGATIFFTVNLEQRGTSLLTDHVQVLRDAYHKTCRDHPFRTDAIVVLPDHLHAVWTLPDGDKDFSTRWRLIKARFSGALPMGQRRASHVARSERGIWQRRFWEHHLRSETRVRDAIRYVHQAPVQHGLVAAPEDWPFSSIHRFGAVRGDHAPYGRSSPKGALSPAAPLG